ncbi:hypothetical protein TIFTF001_029903 [Ficus carica]|uniref:Uncharacterized protein n=1 Tax=Ficus carica TaxID=3494 RepID=A0AA88DTA3_FICCA|nr:hypothetical protein TIFTF001_029903 [Ficus carica]
MHLVGGYMVTFRMARSVMRNRFPSLLGGVTCGSGGRTWKRGAWRRLTFFAKKADPEQNQNRLLSLLSLIKYNWFGSSSMFEYPHDRPRAVQPGEVTIARMPDPAVHYRSRTVVTAKEATTSDQSDVPRGVSVALSHGQRFDNSSLGAWGPRIADEDMDLVLEHLFPTQGLRIEGRYFTLLTSGPTTTEY